MTKLENPDYWVWHDANYNLISSNNIECHYKSLSDMWDTDIELFPIVFADIFVLPFKVFEVMSLEEVLSLDI